MHTDQEDLVWAAEVKHALERAIERQIMRRAWGRIQALEVKVRDHLVVIQGRTTRYFFKQLALQGVLDLIESSGPLRIEMNVHVVEGLS